MPYRRLTSIALILVALLSVACRRDVIEQTPLALPVVTLEASSVYVPCGGRAGIVFNVDFGSAAAVDVSSRVSLVLPDGSEPRFFSLSGVSAGKRAGTYVATVRDNGIAGAYSQVVRVVVAADGGAGVSSGGICVNCGGAEYAPSVGTGLPVVYIDTDGDLPVDSKSVRRAAVIKIRGAGAYGDMLPACCSIQGHGNTSWKWDKKPYGITFRDSVPVLGMPAGRSWVLLANFPDRTLMRNLVAFRVSSLTALDWTPRCVPVELVLNGRHAGSYLLAEQVDVASGRVNISGVDSFLVESDFHYDNEVQWIDPHGLSLCLGGVPFAVRYPSPQSLRPEREAYIKKYISNTAAALYSDSFSDPQNGYAAWIDVDSFVDYWIVYELLGNPELLNPGSVFYHKDSGGRLVAGPCWDFDWCLTEFSTDLQERTGVLDKVAVWYARLFKDPAFEDLVRRRFAELLPQLQEVPEYIEECRNLLSSSAELNFAMWNPAADRWQNKGFLINGDENMAFDDAVALLKQVYLRRIDLLNNYL